MSAREFDIPLRLVTPHLHSQKVKDAQWLLAGHNRFSGTTKNPLATYNGRIDGIYGPVFAGAVREAQYELGYPSPSAVFGQQMYDYLQKDLLTPAMQKLRADRLVILHTPIKVKALELAKTFIGVKETPINHTQFGKWYGMDGVAWCAIFVSYCISHVRQPDWKLSYVPDIVHKASMGEYGMSLTYDPQPGDLVSYKFGGVPDCHVEFYDENIDGHSFSAVGGNTGPASQSNGGEVAQSTRYVTDVNHFIRLTL